MKVYFLKISSLIKKIKFLVGEKFMRLTPVICLVLIFSSFLEVLSLGMILVVITYFLKSNFSHDSQIISFFLNFLENYKIDSLISLSLIILIIFLIKNIFLMILVLIKNKFIFDLNYNLSCKTFYKTIKKPYSYFYITNSASVIRNIENETNNFSRFIFSLITIMNEIVLSFFIIFFLFLINFNTTLIFLIVGLVIIVTYIFLIKDYLKKIGHQRQKLLEKKYKSIQESFFGIIDIKIREKEFFFFNSFKFYLKKLLRIIRNENSLSYFPRYFFEFIGVFLIISILIYLDFKKFSNQDIIVILGLIVVCSSRLYPSLNRISIALQSFKYTMPSLDLLYSQLKNQSDDFRISKKKDWELSKIVNKVDLKKIYFKYERKNFILKNINLKLRKNHIVGIFGESGTGKSTLLGILCGLLKPNKGSVLVNGKTISNLVNLRKYIGLVNQNVFLLDESVEKNIAFGEHENDFKKEKMISILKALNLPSNKRFLKKIVGDKGSKLSGGQKQRIGIARALYHDAQILLFDEITSNLDDKTSDKVIKLIKKLSNDKIVLIISHDYKIKRICNSSYKIQNQILTKI